MIDHIYLPVTDLKRSEPFYGGMLGPLGKSECWHFNAQAGYPDLAGFGEPGIRRQACCNEQMLLMVFSA